jgi:hypothetical protein
MCEHQFEIIAINYLYDNDNTTIIQRCNHCGEFNVVTLCRSPFGQQSWCKDIKELITPKDRQKE